MAKRKKTPLELGKRERQLVETVIRLGEASVSDVRSQLDSPPSYSAVRAMLGLLVEKGWLKFRRDGKRYLYRSAERKETTQRKMLKRLVDTFFGGSPVEVFATLLDERSAELSDQELKRIKQLIQQAEQERE